MTASSGGFVWYELITTDMAAATAFYAKVVGWGSANASMPGMAYTLLTVAGASVAGLMGLPQAAKDIGEAPSWLGYVAIDDVDAAAKRVTQLRGTVHVPPQNIGDISRFALVGDPQMGTVALLQWLKPRRQQPVEPGALGHVRWHELFADDVAKAFAFYAELFGWQKAGNEGNAAAAEQLFAAGGETIGAMLPKPPSIAVPFWLHYFEVGDIDAALARVTTGGGEILNGPLEVEGGAWVAQCRDPQGAVFGLVGTRQRRAVGYFERAEPANPADPRSRRWSW